MNYINVEKGCFCRRPNRFIAEVQLGDGIAVCHVKNTAGAGNCLFPGRKYTYSGRITPNGKPNIP